LRDHLNSYQPEELKKIEKLLADNNDEDDNKEDHNADANDSKDDDNDDDNDDASNVRSWVWHFVTHDKETNMVTCNVPADTHVTKHPHKHTREYNNTTRIKTHLEAHHRELMSVFSEQKTKHNKSDEEAAAVAIDTIKKRLNAQKKMFAASFGKQSVRQQRIKFEVF